MAQRLLRIGVIGLGRAAAQMLPSFLAHPHVAVTAAADPNPAARERFRAELGGRTYAGAEQLCTAEDVDAVYVATPHQYHVSDVLTATANRKHVIVEKPMALTLEECRAMDDAARRNGVVLIVGHSHGFDPAVVAIRELIRRGDVGPLRMIATFAYTNFLYRPRRPEELDSALGGGILYNQLPHQIDVVRTLDGGPLRSIHALAGIWDRARPTEGALTALLDFADGVAASLTYSGYDRFDGDEFHDWVGENGEEKTSDGHGAARRALCRLPTPQDEVRARLASGFAGAGTTGGGPPHHPHFGVLLVNCEGADLRPSPDGVWVYDDAGKHEIRLAPARAYPNKDGVIDELYEAVVEGVPPIHDGTWGTATMAAVLAAVRSARERREVDVSTA